ncbi:MAG TPA: type II secretion system protein GspL [Candidatus Hydrogenedentes bacterium]|nr:type II secretion system protein GspL [Candidatus Hydrogenedentota bacterium]
MARKIPQISVIQVAARGITATRFSMALKKPEQVTVRRIAGSWEGEAYEEAFRTFINELKIQEDRVVLVLPRQDVTTRLLTLPSHSLEEVAGMVQFSAEEYVPYTLDELVIDQCIIKTLDSGESEVMAAFPHKDVVNRPLSLLQQCGITPEKILLSTACLALTAVVDPLLSKERHALVSLMDGGMEILVLQDGIPVFSRGIISTQDWEVTAKDPDAGSGAGLIVDSGAEELAGEIRNSLAAYRRESPDGLGVEHIHITCAYADVALLCRSLSESMNRPCTPAVFTPPVLESVPCSGGAFPAVAVGALLSLTGRPEFDINLLPESESRARRIETIKKRLLQGSAFAVVLLIALGGWYYQARSQRLALIRELEQRIARIEPNAKGITEKREALNILSRQVDRKGSILEQLAALVDAAPDHRLNFLRITLRKKEGVELWGRAKAVNDISDFAQNIRSKAEGHLRFFAQARSLYEQQTQERDQTVFSYQIEALIQEEDNAE